MATAAEDAVSVEEASGTSTTWLLIYTGLTLLVVSYVYNFTYFWRMGIPGPLPLPIFGNAIEIGKNMVAAMDKYTKKHGRYYGSYLMSQPVLVVSDPDFARQVLIKDFPSFQQRSLKAFSIPYVQDSLLEATGEVWKRGRSYVSPTFSGSKMKQMVPDMNRKCDILIEVVDEKTKRSESVDVKDIFRPYVIDNIACCAYGLDSDCQRNPNDAFLVQGKKLTEFNTSGIGIMLKLMFPSLAPYLNKVRMFDIMDHDCIEFFADIIRKAFELRNKFGEIREKKDFLQLMIEAADAGGDESVESNGPRKKIPLTERELLGQSLLFFLGGYETVATTIGYAAYAIARFPEFQKKLQEEVDELTSKGDVPYEAVAKMEYLDKVWCESQRMWPVGQFLERVCGEAFTFNGITFPQGLYMNINVWNIHHDEKYWPNPYTFDPENFSKEAKESRHPCAFMPFGIGPRVCVAQRFAVYEGKISLARLVQKYTLKLDPKTLDMTDIPTFLANVGSSLFLHPPKGIHIHFEPRE